MKKRKIISIMASIMMITATVQSSAWALGVDGTATGTQKAYVFGDDWGCGVSKTVLNLDKTIQVSSVEGTDFTVSETAGQKVSDRHILAAYTSDASGEKVTTNSNYVTIEMRISPIEGSPISWSMAAFRNSWANPYALDVKITEGNDIIADDLTSITNLTITNTTLDIGKLGSADRITTQLDKFEIFNQDDGNGYTSTNGNTMSYATYKPADDGQKHPLVIWNHGAGETGTDVQIDLLGNEVTALVGSEFQNTLDGAYILVPQRATWTTTASDVNELVRKFIADNPNIDTNRVIVGGCSAGGAMTMNMLFDSPKLFAAAYPICPATQSANVTDEMIDSIKDISIWFIHAKSDSTVVYETTTQPLVERLKAVGANVHTSIFDDVRDTTGRFYDDENGEFTYTNTGTPYEYDGHWSWVYFDNNDCYDENGVNLWQWLARQNVEDTLGGDYSITVEGYEWGPGVNKATIKLDNQLNSISKDQIKVNEYKTGYSGGIETPERQITAAYLSDEAGNKVEGASSYATVELFCSPDEGNPFIYTGFNNWINDYGLTFTVTPGAELDGIDRVWTSMNIDAEFIDRTMPLGDKYDYVDQGYKASDGTIYSYASYAPEKDDAKNPLIIWLHGGGEGGTDAKIVTMANEATSLVGDSIQNKMGGAYVFAPQCPTMWMDGYGSFDAEMNFTPSGKGSLYTESLMEMIKDYVANNPDIDSNRIYVGGCSNGGYMTLELVTKNPKFFAAAYPICTGYVGSTFTDQMAEDLKDIPLWFTYAKNDDTLAPSIFSEPIIEKLKDAGATNLHVFSPDDVHSTEYYVDNVTGKATLASHTNNIANEPYQYSGHWSWVYAFNEQAVDNDDPSLELFTWLASQKLTTVESDDPIKPDTGAPKDPTISVKTGDETNVAFAGMLMMAAAACFTTLRKKED